MSNKRCDCFLSYYSPHRGKKCFMRSILGILPEENNNCNDDPRGSNYETIAEPQIACFPPAADFASLTNVEAVLVDEQQQQLQSRSRSSYDDRLTASSVRSETDESQRYLQGIPINERAFSNQSVKDQSTNAAYRSSAEAILLQRTEIPNEYVVTEDTLPCYCTISHFFPHQQGSCQLVTDRTNMALATLGVAFTAVTVASVAADQSRKRKNKK